MYVHQITYLDFSLISGFDNRALGKFGCFDVDPLLRSCLKSKCIGIKLYNYFRSKP